jgi:hypothetical protein
MLFEIENKVEAALLRYGCKGIHNFCFASFLTYFRLREVKATFEAGTLILDGLSGIQRKKAWCFVPENIEQLMQLHAAMPIYSINKIEALGRATPFHEVAYLLAEVFDPRNYGSSKKRHRRLHYPSKCLATKGIEVRELTQADFVQVVRLHDAWVRYKMAQPSTYKIMFPKSRYLRCFAEAFSDEPACKFFVFGAFLDGMLCGARVLGCEKMLAFDLAHFSLPLDGYSDFSEHFAMKTMEMMRVAGIEYLNCGASLNAGLKGFKTHWPHYTVTSYMYSQQKSKEEQ